MLHTLFFFRFLEQDFKTQLIDLFVEGKPLEEVEAEDKEEEEEAKNIQKRLAANLSEEDYDLNLLQVPLSCRLNLICVRMYHPVPELKHCSSFS